MLDVSGPASYARERALAATDVMEQVRRLVDDPHIIPAAPVVLAGAALELALKGAVEGLELELSERPSMTAYARRLRQAHVLTAQDVKDVEQMAGLRNAAAHGAFASSPEPAPAGS